MTTCKTCLFTSDIAKILPDGECEYCKLQKSLSASADQSEWPIVLNEIRERGHGKRYDCLIGISGGEDSSILLYLAVKVWMLRPLVIHFNNRTNRPEADHNIKLLTNYLNVNFIEYYVDQAEYNRIQDSLLVAGLPDADIVNDVAMAKLMDTAAKQYGIKTILNGHDFRAEGSSPKAWSLIDGKYLESVYYTAFGKKFKNYPNLTVWDQILSAIIGIKQIRPFHYSEHGRSEILFKLRSLGWKDYGGKHNENIYTAFVSNYLLPRKFGIDKRRTYLSAQIREGKLTKERAYEILDNPPYFNMNDLGARRPAILSMISQSGIGSRDSYEKTNYRRYRPLFWVLMKLGIFPKTAFKKYCL